MPDRIRVWFALLMLSSVARAGTVELGIEPPGGTGTVPAVFDSTVLTTGTLAFVAGFDRTTWAGSLKAYRLRADGKLGAERWNAGDLLDARSADSRVIFTSAGAGRGHGVPFRWASIGDVLRDSDPALTEAHLNYLRGDASDEPQRFRARRSVLGAIVNSQPLFVARPDSGYRDSFPPRDGHAAPETTHRYGQFVFDHRRRAPMLYVGGNDGMLHAFAASADAGGERWAYVPTGSFDKISTLTSTDAFAFQPTVDASPVARDVFFSDGHTPGWRTILVGGMRRGGRAVYALDITEPMATEADAHRKVLWEFTHRSPGGENLGYTYGEPNIARLAHGRWVVLVPGGYFPQGSTDAGALAAYSSLFVIDAQTGALVRELRTPVDVGGVSTTSYGLGAPAVGDYRHDQIDDVAFAGDLLGQVWRFDLSAENPAAWSVSQVFRPARPGWHPITTMPRLFPDGGNGRFLVVFGSGKFLAGSDAATSVRQAIYGIREAAAGVDRPVIEARDPLVEQIMTERNRQRAITRHPVPATASGWFLQLAPAVASGERTNAGERVVATPQALFNTHRLIFVTLIPAFNDGATFVLDAATGGAAAGGEPGDWPEGFALAGGKVRDPPAGGRLTAVAALGGGELHVPGLRPVGKLYIADALWRRRSWRELGDEP